MEGLGEGLGRGVGRGPFVPEKKSSLKMKEGFYEVVGHDLSDNCLQNQTASFFQFLALCLCSENTSVTNA